jgi:hypothetical protein
MIALPALAIVAVGAYLAFRKPPEAETVVRDEDAALRRLLDQIPGLEKEGHAAIRAVRAQEAGAERRADALKEKLADWLDAFEELTGSPDYRDPATGKLRPEFAGYLPSQKAISQLRLDLVKSSGF